MHKRGRPFTYSAGEISTDVFAEPIYLSVKLHHRLKKEQNLCRKDFVELYL